MMARSLLVGIVPVFVVCLYICSDRIAGVRNVNEMLMMSLGSIPICERRYCQHDLSRKVLFAIKSTAIQGSINRRNLIRGTFVKQIRDYPQAGYTFYLSRPDAKDAQAMYNELESNGDMTFLNNIPETRQTGIKLKTLEFFKNVTNPIQELKYDWICHIDDDSYVQVYRLMQNYLLNPKFPPNRTIIARMRKEPFYDGDSFTYPGGQMYCISWDIASSYGQNFQTILSEYRLDDYWNWPADDLLLGLFLHREGPVGHNRFVDLPNSLAYDIGSSWNFDAYDHAANPVLGINPHKMKSDAHFSEVAATYELTYV